MVRNALPEKIVRDGAPTIKILKYPVDVVNMYIFVRDYIPKLWSGKLNTFDPNCSSDATVHIDFMLHMGMRRSFPSFGLESQARRDGFNKPGVDGVYLEPGDAQLGGIWKGLPEVLKPAFNVVEVGKRLQKEFLVLKQSLTFEFQLYSSLALLYQRKERGRVGFLHIPSPKEDADIELGVKIATTVIGLFVDDAKIGQD